MSSINLSLPASLSETEREEQRKIQHFAPLSASERGWGRGQIKIVELTLIYRPTTLKIKMKQTTQFTAIIERQKDGYVSLYPELDIASQGDTIEDARNNLIEALELFFETADSSEIQERLHTEVFVTRLEINIG